MKFGRLSFFLAFGLLAGQGLAQVPWAGYWRLDEKTGTTAADTSPFKNDGVLKNFTGNPWVAGKIGNALSFDGVDDYVQINIKKALPIYDGKGHPYSITFWVKAPAQNDKRVYSEGSNKSNAPLFTLGSGSSYYKKTDKLRVYIRNDQGRFVRLVSNTTVFDDKWHHVAWVDVSGKAALYVDGVRDTANFDYSFTGIGTRSPNHGTYTMNQVSLGAVLRAATCCYLKGILDDVRVYRFALSAADVKTVMKGGQVKFHGSIGRYGVACGTGPLTLSTGLNAQLGKPLYLQIVQGRPLSMGFIGFGSSMFPLDLAALGFKGCVLYPAKMEMVSTGVLNPAGVSNMLVLPIPNNPALVGPLFYFQGMALRTSPSLGLELSEALVVQFGF